MYSTITDSTRLFTLDPSDATPIYRQVIRHIEYAVLSGRMKQGDRLPTIRRLAVDLKVNPNTIAKAYGELEIRGILVTQVGSGTFISGVKPLPREDDRTRKINELRERFLRDMRALGVEHDELAALFANGGQNEA